MDLTVLHFIVCDRVSVSPDNLHSVNIEGLKTLIRSKAIPPFPLLVPRLEILAILMGGQGEAEFSFRVVRDAPRRVITTSAHPHHVRLRGDPREIKGMRTHVQNCTFPRQGLYWVELVNFGEVLARQPVRVTL